MSRVEIIGDATLYLGDCLEILPTFPKVDAVVTDPPYGINVETDNTWRTEIDGGHRNKFEPVIGDDRPFDPTPLLGFSQAILWGANHYASRLPESRGWLVWNKRDAGSSGMHSDAELAWTNAIGAVRVRNQFWQGIFRPGEMKHGHVHPTQKPVGLMEWCLGFIKSQLVIDPFMGSGTTGVACANLGRKFVGIELDPAYFSIACKRIEDAQRQQRLFA